MADDVVVHEYGDPGAPPMVLLHGLTEAGTTWPDAVEHWGARWRMLAVDLRGHGDSPRFTDEELADTAAVVLADVLRVLDEVRRPVALVGPLLRRAVRAAGRARPTGPACEASCSRTRPGPSTSDPPPPEFFEHQDRFLDAMLNPEPEIRRTRAETSWSEAEIQAWAACKPQVDRRLIHHLGLGPDRWRDLIGAWPSRPCWSCRAATAPAYGPPTPRSRSRASPASVTASAATTPRRTSVSSTRSSRAWAPSAGPRRATAPGWRRWRRARRR